MSSDSRLLERGYGAFGSSTSKTATVSRSVGQILDSFIVHLIVCAFFIAGAIMLMDRYSLSTSKVFAAGNDFFYAIGFIAVTVNAALFLSIIIVLATKGISVLSRDDDSVHWLHSLSIAAAACAAIWSIIALVVSFGSTLVATTTDDIEAAAYFIVLLTLVYHVYLVVRYIMGLASSEPAATRPTIQAASYEETAMRGIEAAALAARASQGFTASPSLFSGAAAFGGIDLSGLQPSSMSTLPASHASAPVACAAPQPMMMPYMMAPQQQYAPHACAPDPNAVYLP